MGRSGGRAKARARGNRREAHERDPYVRDARRLGYRSRAAFKLIEIADRDALIRPGATVVDLGAAPGGWSQIAAARVGPQGVVVALDVLEMAPIAGVDIVRGDFREAETLCVLEEMLAGRAADVVLSDMAPSLSGVKVADQARSMHLAELALEFAVAHLGSGGALLVKVFQGAGLDAFRREMAGRFERLIVRKPSSSRSKSAEFYLLGRGFVV